MKRFPIVVLMLLAGRVGLQAQLSPPELEAASEFARRAAKAAVAGPARVFVEALDADGILEGRLGAARWTGLTERQREQFRAIVRGHFLQTLTPPRNAPGGEIAWSSAASSPAGRTADVGLGLRFGERILKTRWSIRPVGDGWRVADVVLSDPGISLAGSALRLLGPEPVRRRDRRHEAERAAYPRLAALAAIALLLVFAVPRLSRAHRLLLVLTASAPALLFAIDGVLAVQRTLAESYALAPNAGEPGWRAAEQEALRAEREGRLADARRLWARAISEGEPAGPIRYQMGLAARARGETDLAREEFTRALAEAPPAPGGAKELAAIEIAQGNPERAEQDLDRYLQLTGDDPDALSLLAAVRTTLGKPDGALDALGRARSLLGDAWRGARLEAQVRARAGDAAGAVAALRTLDADGRVDRAALRADPAFLPIATSPAWVSFLNEKPPRSVAN